MQERVSRRRVSRRAIKRAHLERERAALVGTDPRRLIWPAAFHIHGQGVCTVDPNGTNLERGASLEPPGRFTNEIGRSSERSKWFRLGRQGPSARRLRSLPRRAPEVLRDHPRSSEVVYELHLAKKSFPLSSTTMKAGKSTTSIFHTASIPSSGYSSTSCFLIASLARIAAGPPIEPK